MDEGFGRNLRKLFDSGDYVGLAQDKLKLVTLSDNKETLTFLFQNGEKISYHVEGDCCSRSWIEHLDVPADINGAMIVEVTDAPISRVDDEEDYECLQVYNTHFKTDRGDIVLEYRNSSNGYYGGYLVRN